MLVFSTIVRMSLAASLVALVGQAIKPLTWKLFNATWHYYVCLAVVVLMLVPLPIMYTLKLEANVAAGGMPAPQQLGVHEGNGVEWGQELFPWVPVRTKATTSYLASVWLLGVLVSGAIKLGAFLSFRTNVLLKNIEVNDQRILELLHSCKRTLGIHQTVSLTTNSLIRTPMLVGLVRPVIMLPAASLNCDELEHILCHELVHLRRRDLWFKMASLVATTLHWFNPVSYWIAKELHGLCELACDEAVVSSMDFVTRKRYAAAILSYLHCAKTQPIGAYYALGGSKKGIQRRLSHMLKYTRTNKYVLWAVAISILLVATGVVAATAIITPPEDQLYIPSNGLAWPLPSSNMISSPFGTRVHPVTGEQVTHPGIDIPAEQGAEIVAAGSGKVILADYNGSYGNTVVIDHGAGLTSTYAHCSKLLVKVGDRVEALQVIAEVGSTGYATGPHLHFEVQQDGESKDPMELLKQP